MRGLSVSRICDLCEVELLFRYPNFPSEDFVHAGLITFVIKSFLCLIYYVKYDEFLSSDAFAAFMHIHTHTHANTHS